jgi:hypothetical protein
MRIFMKKDFLRSWRGSNTYGQRNQWVQAQGSSLTETELATLDSEGIVKHAKGKSLTKIFVRDEDGNLWSVIVHNVHLTALENELKNVGYHVSVA